MADTSSREGISRLRADEGFTLIELLVALAVFSIFVIIVTTAVVQLSTSTVSAKSRVVSSQMNLNAFQSLDREVRYADAINFPGPSATGKRYVEFRLPPASTASGIAECYQWRYDPAGRVIQRRHWVDQVGATMPAWSTIVTNVVDPGGSYPFVMYPATSSGLSQQRLQLKIRSGAVSGATDITTTYVAKNSSTGSPSNGDLNGDGVSDTPVCLTSGNRPS